MNIAKIKTESEFMEMADIWYQRSHKLREIWQNQDTPEDKKIKAFNVWLKLFSRLQACFQEAMKFSQYQLPAKVKKGSKINYVTDYNDPAFLRGEAVIKVQPNFK